MGKIWAISTNKGGVLKTSICSNLSGVLAQKGNKVLIIDTDNQGNILLSFGKNPDECEVTLYDVLVEGAPASDSIVNVYSSTNGSIDVLPANDDMAFFEFDVLTERNKFPEPFKLLKVAAEDLRDKYDYILIDTPPNLGLTQGNVLTYADDILIPFQPENYSMRSLVKILNAIQDFKLKNNQKLNILGVVATLVDQRTTLHSQVLQECRRFCLENDISLLDTVIPRSVRFASSIAYEGLPATLTEKKNPLVSTYFDLLKEIEEGVS
ncbi:chromosome partitioning protein [Evansella vedderi]|uniref:Chromosome partitioning protein n=1 Tax=Evansella vedderi TaxID=38282 RepID=A0ABU0A5I4_9BACI|nr:ParA family protein [Evansella vedderi]MDQ0257963.1 chromosome partitioning protein [Evansella vedderi]